METKILATAMDTAVSPISSRRSPVSTFVATMSLAILYRKKPLI